MERRYGMGIVKLRIISAEQNMYFLHGRCEKQKQMPNYVFCKYGTCIKPCNYDHGHIFTEYARITSLETG